jgi:ATP/maltotriose-dependent transcriptional regulator MalT
VHRDLKPDNVMLDSTERVWLIDFGLARGAPSIHGNVGGEASQAAGTPGYAPPEQWRGAAEPRSDVYALAATLYHLLSGVRPPLLPRERPPLQQYVPQADPAIEALLAQALAADPAARPNAQSLLAAIDALLGADALPPPPPLEPAPAAVNLVGRTAELATLGTQLTQAGALTLIGMPGVGKSALAAALAVSMATPAQTLWHTCRPGDGADHLLWRLAALLYHGGEPTFWRLLQRGGERPPAEVLLDAMLPTLRSRDYLLCFEDLHQLDASGAVSLVERLLRAAAAGGPRLLATARRAPPWLPAAIQQPLSGLSPAAAVAFVALHDLESADELGGPLHAATEGNPQLLTLAIASLRQSSNPARALARLAAAPDLEQYLLDTVDRGLSDEQRAVMESLATLLGFAAPQDALEALLDGASARRALAELRARALVSIVPGDEPAYLQHAMVRDFYYRLLSRGRRTALHQAAAAYYEHEAGDRLTAARHHARAGDPARAAALLADDPADLIGQGRTQELAQELAALPPEQLNPAAQVALAAVRAEVLILLGDFATAQAVLEAAGSEVAAGLAARRLRLLALVDERSGRYAAAENRCLEGMALLQALTPLPLEAARLAALLAEVRLRRGDLVGVETACADGLRLLEVWPRALRERVALLRWQAEAAAARGDYAQAIASEEAALAMATQTSDVWLTAALHNNLGRLTFMSGQLNVALPHTEAAARLLAQIGDVMGQANTLNGLGLIRMASGEVETAQQAFHASRELAERYGMPEIHARALLNLGQLDFERGQAAAAAQQLIQADAIFSQLAATYELAHIRALRGELALALDDAPTAASLAREALAFARMVESQPLEGMALRVLGLAHLAAGELAAAATHLDQAWQQHVALDDPYDQALTLTALARLDVAAGQPEAGRARAHQALTLAREQQITFLIDQLEVLLAAL